MQEFQNKFDVSISSAMDRSNALEYAAWLIRRMNREGNRKQKADKGS